MRITNILAMIAVISATLVASMSSDAFAADGAVDAGDAAWVAACTALVFIMTPGIALFYGGMLRKQSMTSIMAQTMAVTAVMTISWTVVGYSLAFSGDGMITGNLDRVMLIGISPDDVTGGLFTMEFAMFQCAFALVTATIVIGACAERIRFKALVLFLAIWSVAVYTPMAHWVWGGGLFDQLFTVRDFAGGTVVHICGATTGLALAMFAGARSPRIMRDRAHNLPLVFIGFALLWFGWIGFNGGSGLSADGTAANAIAVTQISMASGMAAWCAIQYARTGRTGVLGMISGAVAGLVAITPAAGYVSPSSSIVIGAIGGMICHFAVILMRKTGIDDALDVFAIHGAGGVWGAVATGLFAMESMAGASGLIEGGTDLLIGQIATSAISLAYCLIASYAIIWLISRSMSVRLSEEEEAVGADLVEHGEPSYMI